jgi:hypothetical protein
MRLPSPPMLLLALAAALLPVAAGAWGKPAHRVVAGLAQDQLHPAARAEVSRLLAREPDPTLAGVSGWADEVREDGGKSGRRTRRWHYVDFGLGSCVYEPARDCPGGDCVVAAIDRELLALSDRRRPDAERAEALKYLVHLVADVHQPLHSTPRDDKGGLDFQVSWLGEGDNLHLVWDVRMLERELAIEGLDEAGYVHALESRAPLPADATLPSSRPAVDWAQESCRVVRDGALYPASHVLGDEYLGAHRAQMEQRLRLAGSRLADMLNFALDPKDSR